MHDTELLIIIESFKIWRYYFKEAAYTILVFTNYNNLKKIYRNNTSEW